MRRLGVYSHFRHGDIVGVITLDAERELLTGSTEPIQEMVDARLGRYHNDPQLAFDSLKNWSNGYLWTKELPS